MLFEGQETFDHDINEVWAALHDTQLLTRALPGCKSMKPVGDNSYAVALSLGVAAVKGDYEGRIKVNDLKQPTHFVIEGAGRGAPGFVELHMDCKLEAQGAGTLMRWRCDATVGGLIASIGGRVLSGVSKFLAKQFFNAFRKELGEPGAQSSVSRRTDNVRSLPGAAARAGQSRGPVSRWRAFWAALSRWFSRSPS
jgi:carbon monoxide dehydrogenase subunit G